MKKYITIAALLAAGTACIHAETTSTLLEIDFDSALKPASGDTITYTQGGITFSAKTTSGAWKASGVDGYSNWDNANTADNYTGSWNETSLKAIESTIPGVEITDGDWQDFLYSSTKSGDITFSFSGLEKNTECKLILITGTAFEGTGSWNNFNVGTENPPASVSNVKIYKANSDGVSDYTLGTQSIEVKQATAFTLTATANDNGFVTFLLDSAGSHTTSLNYIAFSGVAAVPEPSAFGLLAGIGALALVASRRRRK